MQHMQYAQRMGCFPLRYVAPSMPGKCILGCCCVNIFGLTYISHPSTAHAAQLGDGADRQQTTPCDI